MNSVLKTDVYKFHDRRYHRIVMILSVIVLSAVLLTGCSNTKKDELEAYRTQMESFFSALSSCSDEINAIDANDENASSDLIAAVDEMADHCTDAAALTPPEGYENVQTLAADACDLLHTASEKFHSAFDGDYDETAFNEGLTSYDSANAKIRDMITLLRGEQE